MGITENVSYLLHPTRVKLYNNYLPGIPGKFIARTLNYKSISIEDVCNALRTRGGFKGDYEDLVHNIHKYYEETAYQLADGYAINNGYYAVYPNIGGTFNNPNDEYDREANPVSFRFGIRRKLRELLKNITIDIDGIADVQGYIGEFYDYDEKEVNSIFVPGDQFVIHGTKIKLAGEDPGIGVYFVPVEDPSKAVKVKRIAENTGSKISGIAPDTEHQYNRLEIRTQYTGSNNLLKTPRSIVSDFVLEII
jgi:hypothetical protein